MKQIRLKDRVMEISCCGRCPCAGRNSMGEYCYIEGKYMDFDDIPDWCPLEDAE